MERKIKVTLLGDQNTGKTSIILRLIRETFRRTDATIGATYAKYINDDITYDLWDTAGSERFMALTPMYYRGSDIIILVYDLSNVLSINKLHVFLDKIKEELKTDYVLIIIGNKLDLINRIDTIPYNPASYDSSEFVCISAKTGENFDEFKQMLFKHGKAIYDIKVVKNQNKVLLEDTKIDKVNNKCEC